MIHLTLLGEPIPFTRPRFNGRRSFNDPRYDTYKKGLALALRCRYPGAPAIDEAVILNAEFYRSSAHRVDLDNLIKTVLDAVQDAGLLTDDALVLEIHAAKRIDRKNPRVRFELVRMDG